MTLSQLGRRLDDRRIGSNDRGASGLAKSAVTSYDSLAGSAVLRRAGKSGLDAPLRGDPASQLLAARRKEIVTDALERQLADFYDAVLKQPIPARILDLVDALDSQRGN